MSPILSCLPVVDNTNVEEIYGWRFHVGDVLTFHYYDGSKMAEKEVTVLGLLNDQYTRDNTDLEGWFNAGAGYPNCG